MRKFTLAVCALILVSIGLYSYGHSAYADARAEIAMELSTGKVLLQKNPDVKLPMASTTKIMTAIIIIEDCDLDEELITPPQAVGTEGSSIYLKEGEKIDVRDLLYGLMLRSGNDAACALAIHHSGSIENFTKVMNERAKEYGAVNTNFTNPHGLPDENHYTTAEDLCKIACHAMNNEKFREIVSTVNYRGKFRNYTNKNKLLTSYEGANGVKTGYTLKAGRCLVSSAERDGMDVVCVVLDCYDMYERSKKILDECFDKYKLVEIDKNTVFMSGILQCRTSKNCKFVVEKGKKIDYRVIEDKSPYTNENGLHVAELEIYVENNLIFCTDLYSI